MDSLPQTLHIVTSVSSFSSTLTAQLSSLGVGMTVTSLLGTFIIAFSMLPQTIMTLRIKQTATLSLAFYTISGIACFMLMIYGFALCVVPWQGWNDGALNSLDQVGSVSGAVTVTYTLTTFTLTQPSSGDAVYSITGSQTFTQTFTSLQNLVNTVIYPHSLTSLLPIGSDVPFVPGTEQANGTIFGGHTTGLTSAQKAVQNLLTAKDGKYSLQAVTAAIIKLAGYNVAMGFTLPGAAVVFGEAFVSITSFMISWQKWSNMRGAKKEGITEAEFEMKYYGERIRAHQAKIHAKAHKA